MFAVMVISAVRAPPVGVEWVGSEATAQRREPHGPPDGACDD